MILRPQLQFLLVERGRQIEPVLSCVFCVDRCMVFPYGLVTGMELVKSLIPAGGCALVLLGRDITFLTYVCWGLPTIQKLCM